MSIIACSVDGCETKVRCKDLCNKHYIRMLKHGDPTYRFKPEGKQTCTVDDCEKFVESHGLCGTHRMRMRRRGTLELPKKTDLGCSERGCKRKHYGLGLCQKHYLRSWSGIELRQPSDVIDGKRQCARCKKLVTVESLGVSARLSTGRNIYCQSCLSDISHQRRAWKHGNGYEQVDRLKVLEIDGWTCHICLEEIPRDAAWPDPLSASMDHVQALSRGGSHTYENIKSSHLACNIRKGVKSL